MQIGLPDRLLERRVPQDDVGVEADANRALAWIKAIDPRVIGRCQLHKFLKTDPSLRHPFREEDRQARFHAGNPVWHPAKRSARIRRQLALRIVIAKRTMIGRKGLKDTTGDTLPDSLLAFLVPRRRRAHIFRTAHIHVEALHIVRGQGDILRAGLRVHGQAPLLSPTDLLHGLPARDVNDHDRYANNLGMTDRAVSSFPFNDLRPRSSVKIRRDMAFTFQPLGQVANGVVPFTMHHHQRLLAAGHLENLEQLLVAQNEVVISHEHLEGRVAVLDERRQLLTENDRRRVGYDQMKRCVDVALALGELPVCLGTARGATSL